MKLAFGSDHAGYEMKGKLILWLKESKYMIEDFGTNSTEAVDYPDYIHPLAEIVEKEQVDFGIILCGSGNGASMVANKHQGIRAALCWNKELAVLARQHNDANILTIPARFVDFETAKEITSVFLSTDFEGGRHQRRVNKIRISQQ